MKYLFIIIFTFNCLAQSSLLTTMGDDNFVYALDMDGSNESLSKTSVSDLSIQATAMTVLAWIKTDTDGALRVIVSKANGISSGSNGWVIAVHSTNYIYAYWMDGTRSIQTTAFDVSDGLWHLIAVNWQPADGDTTAMIFVDGSLKGQALYTKDADIDAITTLIFGQVASVNYYSDYLGEVQIIKGRVLSVTEILEAYALGQSGKNFKSSYAGATIAAWYKWDNNLLQDYSGTGNDLTGSNVDATDQVKLSNYK